MNEITPDIYKDFTPLPKNLMGWNGERAIFARLVGELKPEHIIEVGTWLGQSAITMAKAVKANKLSTKITCVDTWLGAQEFWGKFKHTPERNLCLKHGYPQVYYQFLSNVVHEGAQDVILPLPNTSQCAASLFKEWGTKAEMIYVDASHEYQDVKMDAENYWPLVAPGGVMFGDDWPWGGVAKAIKEFCAANNLRYIVEENNFWVISKPHG